jgi:Protein O-mannosyl-transferase TMEM260-like
VNLLKKFSWLFFSIIIFIIYLSTLAPSVVEIDSGELATVQATLGIAHPTGYPLFTIAGYLFSLIPLNFTKIYQLNILAAIWCSLGAGVFAYTVNMLLDNISLFQIKKIEKTKKDKKNVKGKKAVKTVKESSLPENIKFLTALFSGLILAFSQTYWFQSTSVEVYSLHIFLINLIILFLIKAYLFDKTRMEIALKKRWLIFAAVLALGFSNHMTTLLILPGIAYLYFDKNKLNSGSIKTILLMLLVFFPVLILIYSYLPIRGVQNPSMNWGNPVNFENFFRHVSGKQYQVWLFSSTAAAKKQLDYFINSLPGEFNISLIICLLGVITSYFRARKFFIFMLITFISTVAYSINYDIVDINSYFLLAFIALSFFSAFGIVQILSFLTHKKLGIIIPSILILLFIGIEFYDNYMEVNQSDVYTFRDYTLDLINSTEKNSVIFTYQWDYFVSESYYFRYVENFRKDVAIVDKELMRRSWYYNQLETNYPSVLTGLKDDLNGFLTVLKPFERGEDFNPNIIEMHYRRLMTDLTAQNAEKRNFYIAPELFENEMQRGEYVLPQGYTLVPDLFLFKAVKGKNYVPAANPDFTLRFPVNGNKYTNFIKNNVADMLARRALYEIQNDKIDRARIYIKKIKSDFPGYSLPAGLNQIIIR